MAAERGSLPPAAAHGLIFGMAACSLVYEMCVADSLVLLLGDSIFFFTATISAFILAMGLGSFLARRIEKDPLTALIFVEAALTFLGALCSPAILGAAALTESGVSPLAAGLGLCGVIGALTGLEVPLVLAAQKPDRAPGQRLGLLLIADYTGALVGSVAFAFFLLPRLDVAGTGAAAALVNGGIAVWLAQRSGSSGLRALARLSLAAALALSLSSKKIMDWVDFAFYSYTDETRIASSFRTRYQKVVVTLTKPDEELAEAAEDYETPPGREWIGIFLNGYIQALSPLGSETDGYHHALVHPAMALAAARSRVLILGGGDGLPAKEVLKYADEVERLTMVDLDGDWVRFTATDAVMRRHSHDSLNNPKVDLVVSDAFAWVRRARQEYDVILVDFPEGVDVPLARTYSTQFLRDLKRLLAPGGVIVYQVDSFDTPAFWCAVKSMMASGYSVIPFSTDDSLMTEGIVLLSERPLDLSRYGASLKARAFVDPELLPSAGALGLARAPARLAEKTKDLLVNTFYHPRFLNYIRFSDPRQLSVGIWPDSEDDE